MVGDNVSELTKTRIAMKLEPDHPVTSAVRRCGLGPKKIRLCERLPQKVNYSCVIEIF